ncbi:MAG TPA: NAD(P)-dependent alcohol dehydrogenase [Rhodanobacteraceae bacterium]|nr:NAD(P)-dependent alcohol dehydrogenase [Rhodanobacteraceae bacterium]
MKAVVFRQYGPLDVVGIEDVDKPVPGDDQVLIAIRAASVNALDVHSVAGKPFLVRLMFGLRKPKVPRLGVDVAGVVEAVGRNVTAFRPGDSVFGNCRGAFAEYGCASESAIAIKPDGVTFEQAASIPVAGFTALQALRKGGAGAGKKVLVNGAGGGVGTFAVQIARALGAEVTGVTNTRNLDRIRAIGADRVVDYTREDFTRSGARYDLIVDCHATHSLLACRRALNPGGAYFAIGGPIGSSIDPLVSAVAGLVLSRFGNRKLGMLMAKRNRDDLVTVIGLVNDGKVAPVIDRRFRLAETRDALRYLADGRACGKVVITPEA